MKTKIYRFALVSFVSFLHIVLVSEVGAANKIMCLGDSITQGTSSGVEDEAYQISYRKALYDMLNAAGYVTNGEIFVGTLFSGESVADFDPDHDGHGGFWADEIVTGRIGREAEGILADWLTASEPNIVLLHVGTNDITFGDENWQDIENILLVIDDYETNTGRAVWVVLSLIIERSCLLPLTPPCPKSLEITSFNNDVNNLVYSSRKIGGDRIVLVDMQNGAGINYQNWTEGGDMWDTLHPFDTGYTKMANLWFSGLMEFLPQADAGPDQDVNEFDTVILDASGSIDPKGGNLSYQWAQTAGPLVTLSDNQADQPTFDAPQVETAGELLTFKVMVTDSDGLESTDTIDINILNCPGDFNNDGDTDGLDLATFVSNSEGLALDEFAHRFGRTNCD